MATDEYAASELNLGAELEDAQRSLREISPSTANGRLDLGSVRRAQLRRCGRSYFRWATSFNLRHIFGPFFSAGLH